MYKMKYMKILLSLSIAAAAVIGDYTVFRSKFSESFVFRAFADSAVHTTIGFLSALSFFSHEIHYTRQELIPNVIICTLISSLIDIDHFMVARSLNLKDLRDLNQRGIFHCTTLWILVTMAMIIVAFTTKNCYLYLASFMVVLAVLSHHIRDGNRRGLWIFPFGNTWPINQNLYIFLSVIFPYFLAVIYKQTRHFVKSDFDSSVWSDIIIV